MTMDEKPVEQAVMVDVIGPVAPVMIETLPPTMFTQEFGLVKGCGSFPPETQSLSALINASSPPIAELKVTAVRGARSGVISTPLFSRARWTTRRACRKIGEDQSAISLETRNG